MKTSKIFSIILVIGLVFITGSLFAQPGGPGGPGGGGGSAPIDGGVSIFMLVAAFYGRKALQKQEDQN